MFPHLRQALRQLADFQVPVHAANASFFIIVAIFPLATLLVTLLQFLPMTYSDLLTMITAVVPQSLSQVVDYVLYDIFRTNAVAAISLTGLTALWSASRGVYGILTGLNAIMGSGEIHSYPYRRATAVGYTFVLIIALFLTLVLQVFGQSLESFFVAANIFSTELLSLVVQLRFVFTIAMLALVFTLIFALFPSRRVGLRHAVVGAVFSAVGWVGFSGLFSIYVNNGGGSRFYGSMTVVILTMLWLYVCMLILFYGGIVCHLSAENMLTWKNIRKILQFSEK